MNANQIKLTLFLSLIGFGALATVYLVPACETLFARSSDPKHLELPACFMELSGLDEWGAKLARMFKGTPEVAPPPAANGGEVAPVPRPSTDFTACEVDEDCVVISAGCCKWPYAIHLKYAAAGPGTEKLDCRAVKCRRPPEPPYPKPFCKDHHCGLPEITTD